MKRKVVIIKGYSTTAAELKTDKLYVDYYASFFMSNPGELTVLLKWLS